jgi:hypothetical protein
MFPFFRGDNRIVQAGLPDPTEEVFRRFTGNKPVLVLLLNGFFLNLSLRQTFFYVLYFSGIWQGHRRFCSGKTPKKGTDSFIFSFRCAGIMDAID